MVHQQLHGNGERALTTDHCIASAFLAKMKVRATCVHNYVSSDIVAQIIGNEGIISNCTATASEPQPLTMLSH